MFAKYDKGARLLFSKMKNLYAVSTEGLLFGVDYEVITSTHYEEDEVTHFIKIVNHDIDEALVYKLGLGIVSNLHEEADYYLYCANHKEDAFFGFLQEFIRFEIYYQLTHPAYENEEFEEFIQTERGKAMLKRMFGEKAEEVYIALMRKCNVNKGYVLPFQK